MPLFSNYSHMYESSDRRVVKCQNYTFDGVFRFKSSSMPIHLYIGWALVYG